MSGATFVYNGESAHKMQGAFLKTLRDPCPACSKRDAAVQKTSMVRQDDERRCLTHEARLTCCGAEGVVVLVPATWNGQVTP